MDLFLCFNAGIGSDGGEEEQILLAMSTLSEEGVMDVKRIACDQLLSFRVEQKVRVPQTGVSAAMSVSLGWIQTTIHQGNSEGF